jgi:hypothetical protein
MVLLFATLWKYEMASKNASMQLRRLRRRMAEARSPELVA